MIFGAILAGGKGTRMNISELPKQFLMLGDKPIIIHTIEKFLICEKIDVLYLGIHPDWIQYMEDLIRKYIVKTTTKIEIVPGGKDRNSTIFNIIDEIEKEYGENDNNIIITHDSVRPFVTLRIINENIEAALKYNACDTVVSAVDTIVESKNSQFISNIPDRKLMYQGQTPQSFNISLIKNLYNKLSVEEKEILTDACKICVVQNVPVYLVRGEISNLKITTVADYKIAQAIVQGE